MHYDFTAIPDTEIPRAAEPQWQHAVDTYVSECNKTASMWRAVPDDCLDFRPHEQTNTIRTILVHQLLSERRFFAEFVGTGEPPADQLLPPGDSPNVAAYTDRYIHLSKLRLPQLAAGTSDWWLADRPFFDNLTRQRIWIFWRRVLHTCHHRTQVQSWLRLAGKNVPAIYGPSGDVKSSADDPTYSVAAAGRGTAREGNLIMPVIRHDPERVIDLDLVRCTENAALAAWKYFGKGDKNQADGAASDAMRGMFGLIDFKGLVRIGEGLKDEAPGIFVDEKVGTWREGSLPAAIAVDPIDGTTLTSKGLPGAISVLAVSACASPTDDPTNLFPSIPSHYMEKIAVGQAVAESDVRVQIDAPLDANLSIIAGQLCKRVRDLVVVVLDRPRHRAIIEALRSVGCRVRLIGDGDVAAAIAPSLPESGVDAYVGIGGSPEAVISAAAIKCLGGQQLCRMWPKDDKEREQLLKNNLCTEADLKKVWAVEMMAPGEHVVFAATGISDSPMLPGIAYRDQHAVTHSILMRARNRTVRRIQAYHDLARKTIRMHSTGQEMPL